MPNDEVTDIPLHRTVLGLVQNGLGSMVDHAIKFSGKGFVQGLMEKLKFRLNLHLNETLRLVGYGHQIGNDTVRHEVNVAVDEAMHDLNITDISNGTLRHNLVTKLDQEIELDAFGKATSNWRAGDFFHKMPMKDETLFVSMVCMGVIVPIIIITLFGIYLYKKRQGNSQRRQEMLLREQPEFSLEERTPEEHKGNMGEDVADLDFRSSYQA